MVLEDKKWKKFEDDIIKAGVMKYGTNKWSKISTLLQSKTSKQCKDRWKYMLSLKNEFNDIEIIKLLEAVKTFGNQWTAISKCFTDKSPQQCYEMYQSILKIAAKVQRGSQNNFEIISSRICSVLSRKDVPFPPENGIEIFSNKSIEYFNLEEDEKDMVNIARVRLQNLKSRKHLKSSKTFKNKKL